MTKQNTAKAALPGDDLRQRAARARDAAGRFIRRQAPAELQPEAPHRSDLAQACDRAVANWITIQPTSPAENGDDEGLDVALDAYDLVFRRAIDEPSDGIAEVQAKARLLLCDLIEHTAGHDPSDERTLTDDERLTRVVLREVIALPGGVPTTFSAPHPDAALFALGDQFMAAWVAEDAVEVAEREVDVEEEATDWKAYNDCKRIAEQIVRTPAVTPAGYGIKALLLARYDSEDSGPSRPIAPQGSFASDWNVLRQTQQGAARLAAAPDMGIPISPPADPVTGIPVSGNLIEDRLPAPGHDLSQLSIVELARLYPVVVRVEEVMGSAENAPCFWEAPNTYRTPAGKIINREADRLGQFTSAIAEEMRRRPPADDDEAEERANTLLWHTVVTGGVAEHPELIAEINATWGA
ncbi:hypothetical protein FV242_21550 [Methylobacterium sp. WL64]|uniref:hypothetical protein n=1 Tax=Methylobacterium sp. WL64 TaxID=2603894 RepID=UPI0011C99301|nr:hypothetical protein [Methylobacterium sp. WL64]TXN00581.1 hypothetical protein FV242_21550 [Methylobacterium sp. WL64]